MNLLRSFVINNNTAEMQQEQQNSGVYRMLKYTELTNRY